MACCRSASPQEGEQALPTWCTTGHSINPTPQTQMPGTRTQGVSVTGLEVRHQNAAMSACVHTDGRWRNSGDACVVAHVRGLASLMCVHQLVCTCPQAGTHVPRTWPPALSPERTTVVTMTAVHTPSPRSWALSAIFQEKKPGLLGEMAVTPQKPGARQTMVGDTAAKCRAPDGHGWSEVTRCWVMTRGSDRHLGPYGQTAVTELPSCGEGHPLTELPYDSGPQGAASVTGCPRR